MVKRLIVITLIIVLLVAISVGGVWAQRLDDDAEPTATLLSSTNTDDEGLCGSWPVSEVAESGLPNAD